MSFYDHFMAPLEFLYLKKIRQELMPKAKGNVLEIAFGTGVNMPYYHFDQIDSFHALDISENMKHFDSVTYHKLSAETLPFQDKTFDTVVLTLALCSIPDPIKAIKEIKRVLKDDGMYLFLEHERPKNTLMFNTLKIVNPIWVKMSKGCQITLESHKKIINEGFKIKHNIKNIFHYGVAQKSE